MTSSFNSTNWLLGLLGGIVGGVLGYFAFFYLARLGLYAIVLPGALIGLGCGSMSGFKSNTLGIVCGLLATLLGLFVQWRFAPFLRDPSFSYFLAHVHDVRTISLVMIAIGGLFGFWFGRGRTGGVWIRHTKNSVGD